MFGRMATGCGLAARAGPEIKPAVYDAAATAYFAALSVQPTGTRKAYLNALIVGLKSDGVWAKLTWLNLLAAHDAQAGLVNLIAPGTALATSGGPAFTADRGYAGDGVAAHLTHAARDFTLNNASVGVYLQTIATSASMPAVGGVSSALARIAGFGSPWNLNDGGATTTGTNNDKFRAVSRSVAGSRMHYGGSAAGVWRAPVSVTLTSTSVPTGLASILRSVSVYSDARVAAYFQGAALTDAEMQALYTRVLAYVTAVGAQ